MLSFIHTFHKLYTNPRMNCSTPLYKSLSSDVLINEKKTKYIDQKYVRITILWAIRGQKVAICGLWSQQFIVAEGHNILEVTERLFVVKVFHSSLWLKSQQLKGYISKNCWQPYWLEWAAAAAAAATAPLEVFKYYNLG